ncbi:MAG: Rrf2 family transcriptional regulator [Salinivirgaceae bacterium]|jgi:Rrf2 family protein
MKINTNIRYGLRAMVEIAKSPTPVLQKEIAERQEISVNYLDSIIAGLKNAGLIVNYEGKGSGYILAKKPKDITVYQIYRAFSPELQLVNCLCETNECRRSSNCPSKDYWFELNSKIKDIMDSKTIEELLKDNFLIE